MIAFLPALLLLLMQGSLPADALDARMQAELWLHIQGRSSAVSATIVLLEQKRAAPIASPQPISLNPSRLTTRESSRRELSDTSLPSSPALTGDRSRDGP